MVKHISSVQLSKQSKSAVICCFDQKLPCKPKPNAQTVMLLCYSQNNVAFARYALSFFQTDRLWRRAYRKC